MTISHEHSDGRSTLVRQLAIWAGPVIGAALYIWLRPTAEGTAALSTSGAALTTSGAAVVGLLVWMALWWMTQAVDLAVTGLLPIIVLPLLGTSTTEQALAPYANDVIFLFAGGCVLGLALERHGIARRFLMSVIGCIGHAPRRVIAAFLIVSALISAWVSNTATAAMMLPLASAAIAMYAVSDAPSSESHTAAKSAATNFQHAILLAVAYGATIGGVMTVLGSPPNPIGAEWINANGGSMDFLRWSSIGVPTGVLMMICALVIFRFVFPCHALTLTDDPAPSTERVALTRAGKLTIVIFALTVIAWVSAPFVKSVAPSLVMKDGMIAIAAAIVLFILPAVRGRVEPIVPWALTQRLPWGVFMLFGGGLSLADAMQRTGVSKRIAECASGLGGLPEPLVIAGLSSVLTFASEIASNTALTATAVPIVGAMAPGLGVASDKLVIMAALSASLAFMLPVGTPPNAIVYSTGLLPMRTMMRVGLLLNICAIVVITIICAWWV